jgi:hypothetical protein
MSQESLEIAKFSPYKLVQDYAETPVWKYAVIAIVIHLVVVGATSVKYIANLGKEPQAAVQPAANAGGTPTGAATPTAAGPGPTAGTAQPPASASPTAPATGEAALLDQHKDTKIIQAITETAKPEDIPAAPDDLGISIKDTERPKK